VVQRDDQSETVIDQDYTKLDDHRNMINERRLSEVRMWVMLNNFIFLISAPTLHYNRFNRMEIKGQLAITIQSCMHVPITIMLMFTFLFDL
jgi:hypothetical protein